MNEILNTSEEISELSENEIIEETNTDINNVENIKENEEENIEENDDINNNFEPIPNCLALVVKENYHLVTAKNFIKKSFRVSWKVALSIFTINFLNLFI